MANDPSKWSSSCDGFENYTEPMSTSSSFLSTRVPSSDPEPETVNPLMSVTWGDMFILELSGLMVVGDGFVWFVLGGLSGFWKVGAENYKNVVVLWKICGRAEFSRQKAAAVTAGITFAGKLHGQAVEVYTWTGLPTFQGPFSSQKMRSIKVISDLLSFDKTGLAHALTCDVGMGFQLSPPLVDECQHVRWHLYCRDTQEHYRVEAEEEELSSIITAGPGVPLSRHVKNRVAKIDGMSVRSAVSRAKYTKDGQSVLYKKADFKWDLGHNYIHLVPS